MNHHADVLIVGGGIVGLSAALGMAQAGYHVAVIDAGSMTMEAPKMDSRVYAINHASKRLLESIGAWGCLDQKRLCEYRHMHVWDAISHSAIDFDSTEIAAASLGTMIEEWVLKNALLEAVLNVPSIQLFANASVDAVTCTDDGVQIQSNDVVWHGLLLMVADGARSATRDALKVGMTTWSYNHHALVATVKTELPHQNTAWQVFHKEGPLALLPLVDAHHCSIVWSNPPARTDELMHLSVDDFNQQITQAFENTLGEVTLESHRAQFPLVMRHVKNYVGTRWMVLGDAAHTIHPLAGLGLNLGLADVQAWLTLVRDNTGNPFAKRWLKTYQRERKHAVWQVILMMEGLKQIFGATISPVSTMRGMGINWINRSGPLKRMLIQHAAGDL